MKATKLLWSPEALGDLAQIWDYYTQVAGAHTAERILLEIDAACDVLAMHQLAGRARDDIRPGLRSTVISTHVIFYRLHQAVPQIVRVLDERQDVEESLF